MPSTQHCSRCWTRWGVAHGIQYIPRNMHTVFALLWFVVVIDWLIFPYPSGLLHWHCGNLTIAPVPAKQRWWIWLNTSCEFIMNDCITTTKQSTTKPCAYFLGYTVAQCWDVRTEQAHSLWDLFRSGATIKGELYDLLSIWFVLPDYFTHTRTHTQWRDIELWHNDQRRRVKQSYG